MLTFVPAFHVCGLFCVVQNTSCSRCSIDFGYSNGLWKLLGALAWLIGRGWLSAFSSCWLVLFAHAERLRFHIEVGLGVYVGGVERDVPEPRADGIDCRLSQ